MKRKSHKPGLVVGLFPEQYRIADPRLNKPVCHQQIEGGKITGSMLLQDLETASIDGGKEITYLHSLRRAERASEISFSPRAISPYTASLKAAIITPNFFLQGWKPALKSHIDK